MSLRRLPESSVEPRCHEVYGSSARLAFSRYFVVAHVDGFIYVLDKYFCISRLVPDRSKRPSSPASGFARQKSNCANGSPLEIFPSQLETHRLREEDDGRHSIIDQTIGGDSGSLFPPEDGHEDGGNFLVPIRIADVFSALFRSDKPVFSQLLTGNNQYDQRQLQALRQKSLLLSNRRDGCLYLFLKNFLLRVSLRGTVTVVADLLQLALAAARRLHSASSVGTISSGVNAAATRSQDAGSEEAYARRDGASPIPRVECLRRFCIDMGYDEKGFFLNAADGSAQCADVAPHFESASQAAPQDEAPMSGAFRSQVWRRLRLAGEPRECAETTQSSGVASSVDERLQEFLTCKGKGWEVSNCCIDGGGRCFYTLAQAKALSPLQHRGMIFYLDTQSAVVRTRLLQFGRGVSEDEVLSLSLAPHPLTGCFLVVAKSATAVRGSILSPCSAPLAPGDADSIVRSSRGSGEPDERGTLVGAAELETPALLSATAPAGSHDGPMATLEAGGVPALHQSSSKNSEPRISTESADSLIRHDTNNEANNIPVQREIAEQPQLRPLREETLEQIAETGSAMESGGERHAAVAGAADRQPNRWQKPDGPRSEGPAVEHSTWWFCPCEEEPSFYFPVAEWLHDEAIHSAAQSVCRQFRGSPDTSVCRAYVDENDGIAVRAAAAAATAACKAELLVANAMVQSELETASPRRSAASEGDSATECVPIEQTVQLASRALKDATIAAARAESAARSGYILWQQGVKVKRPKTGEEAINFGSAMLIRMRAPDFPRAQKACDPGAALCCPRPARALDSISGEVLAVISQDARHLEVRDALPSPLGFIVVPAEAANRIVKQRPGDSPSRSASRNAVSLTSFLPWFLTGSASAVQNTGDEAGAISSAGNAGSVEGSQLTAEAPSISLDVAAGGGAAAALASANSTADSFPNRAIPAVNVVFLVDTLRVCRFAEPSPASLQSQVPGHSGMLVSARGKRLMGISEVATDGATAWPSFESFGSSRKPEAGLSLPPAVVGESQLDGSKSDTRRQSEGGRRCSCRAPDALGLEPSHDQVLHSQFADVLLLCADGFEIPSHRALLAARCSFFEAKLTRSHWEPRGTDKVVIDLREFPGLVVQATVRFFETGTFIIPAACCCPHCCTEARRHQLRQQQAATQSGLPPYDLRCCCRVDWVLQAYTFAAYCLLEDLQAELLFVLSRLISQRTCLHVLTHPAVRNQQQILQLAAHQLVYHMPHPNLLLEGDDTPTSDLEASTEGKSPEGHPELKDHAPPIERSTNTDRGKKPLLPLLLSEGIYDVIVTALRAWVLDSRQNALFFAKLQLVPGVDPAAANLRSRQLLVLLALRLLQGSVVAPSSRAGNFLDSQSPAPTPFSRSPTFIWENSHTVPRGSGVRWSALRSEKTLLAVPLRDSQDKVRYFMFRDVVLFWARMLKVSDHEAKDVAQGLEELGLP